jgi:hypothetical protein
MTRYYLLETLMQEIEPALWYSKMHSAKILIFNLCKYSSIVSSNYIFKGLAFVTLGPWCKQGIDFINVIGNRLIAESGDSKSKKFLFERISLFNVETLQAFGAFFHIPHYYRKFLHCK